METTETPNEEPEQPLTIPEARDVAFGALHDVLEHLYPDEVESVAGNSAWAAYWLLHALTLAAAEGEKETE